MTQFTTVEIKLTALKLELKTALSGCRRQLSNSAVIAIHSPVETHFVNARSLSPLRNRLAYHSSRVRVATVTDVAGQGFIAGACGSKCRALEIINDLAVDVLVAPKNGQARPVIFGMQTVTHTIAATSSANRFDHMTFHDRTSYKFPQDLKITWPQPYQA